MSNRIFSDNVAMSELPCMNCLRVEMGERACYNGQYIPVLAGGEMSRNFQPKLLNIFSL